jgi:spermidine synthase
MAWFFVLFFVSGFCSILYEIIWLRLAMAQFGVTSALVSIVLSMFMAGLGLGSWAGGYAIQRNKGRIRISALGLYGLTELLISASALAVPYQLRYGRGVLESIPVSSSWSYYLLSGFWIALTLIPLCACMGATIPIAMSAIRDAFASEASKSFSTLYRANVLGAVLGAILPLVLIEIYGFRGTLRMGAQLNALVFLVATILSLRSSPQQRGFAGDQASSTAVDYSLSEDKSFKPLLFLFLTGLTSMGAEVVWIREFTPYLGTVVYAFAAILCAYLTFTFVGARLYRYWSHTHQHTRPVIWSVLGFVALLPSLTSSPEFHFPGWLFSFVCLVLGIGSFSGILGFVTPMLVDRWSKGDSNRAGNAYAVNVLGCIVGPLISGFVLLPLLGERRALFVFALPWLFIGLASTQVAPPQERFQRKLSYALVVLALVLIFTVKSYDDQFARRIVPRDNTATVVATGDGMSKRLLVNGIGITSLTPITKLMTHLPLAFHQQAPRNALVVCFGMGTTYRSLLSWNIPVTAVELVPSVPRLFGYFHPDGPGLLCSRLSRVVIDDGRRYLERSREQFDVITIDPPPPVEAAGTSLLYSKEFYDVIYRRLSPSGVVQQWLPGGDAAIQAAVARALKESFPYVRVFHSLGREGFHSLASSSAIPSRTAAELADGMPSTAARDLVEWGPETSAQGQFAVILGRELPLDQLINGAPEVPALQDDRPENEYYMLRESSSVRPQH